MQPNQNAPLPPTPADINAAGNNFAQINPLNLTAPFTTTPDLEVVNSPTNADVQTGEIGKSGTYIFSGIITQEEYNADLTRFQALWSYDVMRRSDSTVKAALLAMMLPIQGTDWSIQSASDDDHDVMVANFIRRELFQRRVVFGDFIREALLMLPFGFSVFEKVLEWTSFTHSPAPIPVEPDPTKEPVLGPDGKEIPPEPIQPADISMKLIGLAKLGSRKQRSIFKWEQNDGTPGIHQILPGANYDIPWDKLVIFTHEREGDNFEGISVLRAAYKHWYMKDKMYLIDAIKIEKQSLGILEIEPPEGADEEMVDDAIEAAQQLRANEMGYFKHPPGWLMQYMDMKANTTVDTWPSITHHDGKIYGAVLAQFLQLTENAKSGGSKALSTDHSDLFEKSLEAVAKNIAATIQHYIIQPLCDMNFAGLNGNYPTIEHGKIADDKFADIATGFAALVTAGGMTMDPNLEQWIRSVAHAPDLPQEYKEDYANRPMVKPSAAPTTAPPATSDSDDQTSDEDDDPLDSDSPNPPPTDDPESTDDNSANNKTEVTATEAMNNAKRAKDNLLRVLDLHYADNRTTRK